MKHSRSNGSVLILVLVVCLGLVSITLLFGHNMILSYRGADNDVAGRQADLAIEGTERYAESILSGTGGAQGAFPDPTSYAAEALPVGDSLCWIIGRPGDNDPVDQPVFGLVDEASKLNLNTATLDMLETLPGMTPDLAAAIIDWRDKDETPGSGGAETQTYALQKPAYSAKDAPFESIYELALLNGGTNDILYGEDTNLNGVLDLNENDGNKTLPLDNADGNLDAGILEYVTAFSREPNLRADGTKRINVSQPSSSGSLNTVLTGTFGAARAAAIRQNLGTTAIHSTLEFFIRSKMTEDEFNQIANDITVSNADAIVGLVNVNTASRTVLACIPGIGTDYVDTLIATRSQQSTPPTSVAWVAAILGEQASIQAGPYLTAQSWQVSADIAAVGKHGRGYRRVLYVIDKTDSTARIVYRRNMAPLGWALGAGVRDMLAQRKEQP